MALSYQRYSGDGTTATFSVPFLYLSRTHVTALVDGVGVPFTWLNASTVRLSSPPVAGSVVEVQRATPLNQRITDFVDGSTLTENDLDTSATQLLYLAQETYDVAKAALNLNRGDEFDAKGKRISNVADPLDMTDGVNKRWANQAIAEAEDRIAGNTAFVFVEKDPSTVVNPPGGGTYIHSQDTATAEWIVEHYLNTYPTVTAYDLSDNFLVVEYHYIDKNKLRIVLNSPRAGVAYIH